MVTCPCKSYRQIVSPPFCIFTLQEFCIGFTAQVKLYAMVKNLGMINQRLEMFETHLVSRRSNVDYKIFNNFSSRVMKTISGRVHNEPDGMDGISVSLNSDLICELQYPESKEFLLGLEKLSKIKTILKHVFILAVSLTSTIGFILVLWCMHVFAFVWSCLKHCIHRKDEPNCTAKYGLGDVKDSTELG